jgi:hypothetical protein
MDKWGVYGIAKSHNIENLMELFLPFILLKPLKNLTEANVNSSIPIRLEFLK